MTAFRLRQAARYQGRAAREEWNPDGRYGASGGAAKRSLLEVLATVKRENRALRRRVGDLEQGRDRRRVRARAAEWALDIKRATR